MAEANPTPTARPRPLSPHMQIYRPLINMVMSILHRATGVALSVGAFALAWWLTAVAAGGDSYSGLAALIASRCCSMIAVRLGPLPMSTPIRSRCHWNSGTTTLASTAFRYW